MTNDVYGRLFAGLSPVFGLPMSKYTSFRVGGDADIAFFPGDIASIIRITEICRENCIPFTVLGRGSNVVVSDEGIEGAVIILGNELATLTEEAPGIIAASAGVRLTNLCNFAQTRALSGLEFAYGIPGSVGGAVFMNAGAYGGETAQVIAGVTYLTRDGRTETVSRDECDFGYRHSVFAENGGIVLSARFELETGNKAQIREKMEEFMSRRKDKQPLEYPSAGSVFRRPEGYFAGALIEQSGLKGASVGGAQVSRKHAGFIINSGGATARDIRGLVRMIQDKVLSESGVGLECEIKFIGRNV